MSILTSRGEDRKSLSDVPIHLTGFSSLPISIPVYIFLYISASVNRRFLSRRYKRREAHASIGGPLPQRSPSQGRPSGATPAGLPLDGGESEGQRSEERRRGK